MGKAGPKVQTKMFVINSNYHQKILMKDVQMKYGKMQVVR